MALFAAIALLIDKLKNRQSDKSDIWYLFGCGLGIAVLLFSLGLTRSKGAAIGLFFAAAAFFMFLLFGNWLKAHKRVVLVVCLLLAVAGGWAVVSYGLNTTFIGPGCCMTIYADGVIAEILDGDP